ncbi:hypothetical protein [Kribbella deserti]|uniref:Uncharacterized protein n=1 Tax=Kribbella deserti TaxID=1926257 RepID=A0ABV6QK95_9ACTN
MTANDYFVFPVLALAFIGAMVLLLRWAFSPGKGSLVRRIDATPAPRDTFGLLIDVHTATSYAEARKLVELLTAQQIRATAARTHDGWTIYVWPVDELSAREVLKS